MTTVTMAVSITAAQGIPIACSPRGAEGEATLLSPQLFRVMKINEMIASVTSTPPNFSCVLTPGVHANGPAEVH